ncbi:cytidine deaminase-like [Rhynchophorus ferrugineus]|uniref:Cytidine deaminase n=1 Tax=Rhynchophorus ferrugineus TaxID=354439 RepID=A0A834HRI8_RHYFE|nr:hypothetical protein GWI33_020800 [Rhynchophorus ferrugineus]
MSKASHENIVKNVQKLKNLDQIIQNLIREATEAREYAYCPYSKFKVGAALLCTDGTVVTGCNIENCSFTVGICAERCAYGKAISQGKNKFKAVSVVAYQEKYFTLPCGACRQFMSEFGNLDIYVSKPGEDNIFVSDLETILPYQFCLTDNKTFV